MNLENSLSLSEERICTLEIFNKTFFRKIIESLFSKLCLDAEEPYIIIDELSGETLSSDELIIINDVYSFNMDDKKTAEAIVERIKQCINSDEDITKRFHNITAELYDFLMMFSNEFECDFMVSEKEIDIFKYLKLFGFTVTDYEVGWFDKLLSIITLYADLFPNKALCFVNIKAWLNNEEIVAFFRHITNQKMRVLIIESEKCEVAYNKEYKIEIDENFDEIICVH